MYNVIFCWVGIVMYLINFSLLFRNRNFGLLYLGQAISFLGTMITSVAVPYQVYHLTHSTLMIGLCSLFQLAPLLVTALFGGALADRYHRKKLLIIAEIFLALGSLLFAFNTFNSSPKIWIIFLLSAFMSCFSGLHRPSFNSLMQQLLKKEDMASASTLTAFIVSFNMIAGPAFGGLIIAHFGLMNAYLVDFFSFAFSLLAISLITTNCVLENPSSGSPWASIKEGLRYAWSRQELLGSYSVDFLAMIFGMPIALFPAIAQNYEGAKTLGLLYSAPAAGALILSFMSGWTKKVKHHGRAIGIAAIFWGLAIVFFGLASNLYLALFFLMLAGAMDAVSGIFRSTLWNETIPTRLRGRLSGIEMISYLSGPKLGDTESGLAAACFGITFSVVSGGLLCIFSVMLCCFLLPQFWNYRSSISADSLSLADSDAVSEQTT